jgi:hypothetical protein
MYGTTELTPRTRPTNGCRPRACGAKTYAAQYSHFQPGRNLVAFLNSERRLAARRACEKGLADSIKGITLSLVETE